MKIAKAHFALRATAFQLYYYLLMKLEAQPEAQQERRIIQCSKGELERFFQLHPNTVRVALDLELERDFRFIQKLQDEPNSAKNRIMINTSEKWNFALIKQILIDKSMKRMAPKPGESLFDDVLKVDGGTTGNISENTD